MLFGGKNSKRVYVTQEVPPTAMQRREEFLLVSSPGTSDDSLFVITPKAAHPTRSLHYFGFTVVNALWES